MEFNAPNRLGVGFFFGVRVTRDPRLPHRFFRLLKGSSGMLERLARVFMARLVIAFLVVRRRDPMGVRGKFVKLGCSLIGILWHNVASVP